MGHIWFYEYMFLVLVGNLVVAGGLEYAYRRGLDGRDRKRVTREWDEVPTVQRSITWG